MLLFGGWLLDIVFFVPSGFPHARLVDLRLADWSRVCGYDQAAIEDGDHHITCKYFPGLAGSAR